MRAALAILVLLAVVPAVPAGAAEDPVALARAAAGRVIAAAGALRAARDSGGRLAAHGQAVRAYEEALAALRAALRAIGARRAALRAAADAQARRLAALAAALQLIERQPGPLRLVHPGGPVAAARAAHLIAGMLPALDARVGALSAQLAELDRLEAERAAAEEMMRQGLAGLQGARAALADALSRRRLPDPPDPALAARLAADSASLGQLAERLAGLGPAAADSGFSGARGRLSPPVAGSLALRFGERDAEGRQRAGVMIAARPGALVTAPWRSVLRYVGALPDLGQIAILEPQAGWLIVLAGLGRVDRLAGEVLEAGEPVGVLGGLQPSADGFLIDPGGDLAETRSETLYMELRQDGVPVDPAPWFRFGP
ncbi:MAG: hypothetical protein KatS3mg118_1747 [Paracoccaceae bacterium]|nr:MAG: hypothetical protein KatS3mg118_1747 [Paracoccaceae bacterium]